MSVSLDNQALITRYDGAIGPTLSSWARRNRRNALDSLAREVHPLPLTEVTANHLASWLRRCTPRTRDLWLSHSSQFFAWAKEHKLRRDDPAAELRQRGKPPARAKPAPGTLEHLAFAWVHERCTTSNINRTTGRQQTGILLKFVDVASSTDPSKVTKRDVVRWLASQEGLSANTRRLYFSTLRAFLQWLVEDGHLGKNPMRQMKPPSEVRTAQVALDGEQIRALLGACRDDRERLIVVLSLHTGLRRAELARIEISDLSLSGRTLVVRNGKGGHGRVLPLAAEACEEVRRYLAENGLTSGPLLRSVRHPQSGIVGPTIGALMRQLALQAGVKVRPGDGIGTHSFRRTMATDTYTATGDVLVVRDLLGHSLLNTTERYIRYIATERMREAVEGRTYLDAPVSTIVDTTSATDSAGGAR